MRLNLTYTIYQWIQKKVRTYKTQTSDRPTFQAIFSQRIQWANYDSKAAILADYLKSV